MLDTLREIREALERTDLELTKRGIISLELCSSKNKLTTLIEQWESEEMVERVKQAITPIINDLREPDVYTAITKATIKALTGEAGEVG